MKEEQGHQSIKSKVDLPDTLGPLSWQGLNHEVGDYTSSVD